MDHSPYHICTLIQNRNYKMNNGVTDQEDICRYRL